MIITPSRMRHLNEAAVEELRGLYKNGDALVITDDAETIPGAQRCAAQLYLVERGWARLDTFNMRHTWLVLTPAGHRLAYKAWGHQLALFRFEDEEGAA
jgi:hypothetical protein